VAIRSAADAIGKSNDRFVATPAGPGASIRPRR
jgi:hypothetical protein